MKSRSFASALVGLIAIAAALVFTGIQTAQAHPLGNFTVNRYARLELERDGARLRYVLDMAEIPAFSEIQAIDRNHDGAVSDEEARSYGEKKAAELERGLVFTVDGRRIDFTPLSETLTFPEGQAGLKTLRLVADFAASPKDGWPAGTKANIRDTNYDDRIGWREIVVHAGDGVGVDLPPGLSDDISQELTAYPADRLTSPLNVRQASFVVGAGGSSVASSDLPATRVSARVERPKPANGFARLITRQDLTPAFLALSLLLAAGWGAAHALGPGHGKTIVAAYLVGERGTARHAIILGLTVTLTHTSTVVTLGLVTLYASRFVAAEDLYMWLSLASGVMVVAMGAFLFLGRLRRLLRQASRGAEEHAHGHEHGHVHPHDRGPGGHSHEPGPPGLRGLVALGISGGLLPCPTALVVMLAAIALDRIAYGLVLILAFSTGLAGVLTGIGLMLVFARRLQLRGGAGRVFERIQLPGRVMVAAPLISAAVIFVAGLVLTSSAVRAL